MTSLFKHFVPALAVLLFGASAAPAANDTLTVISAPFGKTGYIMGSACEDIIKEKLSVTSRCMPFGQEHIADTCVCCGKPAKKMVYWGRAY